MAIVGQGITAYPQPDDALNENSKNPVQNKVVAGNIKELKGKDTVQDERIAAMEQVTTATTIGPVALATFDASAADMPLKGLTVDIEPVQDLHGYDHPWPAGGGKNLWNPDWVINGYISSASHDIISDPTARTVYIPVNEGLTYTVSKIVTTRFRYGFASEMPASGKHCSDYGQQDSAESITVVAPTGALYLCVYVCASDSDNTVLPSVQIEVGSTATAYSPYSNICPITGWTGCKVVQTGKNLLPNDGPGLNNASGAATFVKNDDGTVSASGEATAMNRYYRYGSVKLLPGRYTLSGCPSGGTQDTYFIALRTESYGGTLWSRDVGRGYTFTISSATTVYITLYAQPGAGTVNLTFSPMIRLATVTDADYEPYQGNIYSITFPTEAGTVYGGTLTVNADGSGELTVDKAIKTIDDQTSFSFSSVATIGWFAYTPTHNMKKMSDYLAPIVSDSMMTIVSEKDIRNHLNDCIVTGYNDSANTYPGQNWIYWKVPGIESKNDMIAWLGLHSFTVVYPLASPIAYGFSDIHEITTLFGTNNIWADTGDVTVTYGAYLETVKELVDKREMREEQVEGTVVNLNAEPNTRYICGEVATLDITLPASGTCDIVFTSGSTPTVLTVPSTVKWMHGFDPTALAADTIYELNITDGLGVVASWT